MNDEQRLSARGPAAADRGLGPEQARSVPLPGTPDGHRLNAKLRMQVVLAIVGPILIALAVYLGSQFDGVYFPIFGTAGMGCGGMALAVRRHEIRTMLQSELVIHEDGIVAHRDSGDLEVIPWEEVAALQPSKRPGRSTAFFVLLRNRRQVQIARLSLAPRQDNVGWWLPHPDTVPLLEHYLEWCRRTGRHPKIEPVNASGF